MMANIVQSGLHCLSIGYHAVRSLVRHTSQGFRRIWRIDLVSKYLVIDMIAEVASQV